MATAPKCDARTVPRCSAAPAGQCPGPHFPRELSVHMTVVTPQRSKVTTSIVEEVSKYCPGGVCCCYYYCTTIEIGEAIQKIETAATCTWQFNWSRWRAQIQTCCTERWRGRQEKPIAHPHVRLTRGGDNYRSCGWSFRTSETMATGDIAEPSPRKNSAPIVIATCCFHRR